MWDILLPHLGDMRRAAKLLATDALIAAQDGQSERVIDDILALNNLARLSGSGFSLIEQLGAVQIETTAHETIVQILTEHLSVLDDADLAALNLAGHRLSAREPLIDLEGERAMVLDVLQRTYSPAGHLTKDGARFIATKSVGPTNAAAESRKFVKVAAARDTVVNVLDQLLVAGTRDIETPHWQRQGWNVSAVKDVVGWDSWSARFCAIDAVMNSYNRVANQCERLRQRRGATSVAVALCRHRLRHNAFPASLAGLDADLLDHVPRDRFSGEPLQWVVSETEAVLYSIGNDRDDDGGSPIADTDNLNWLPPGDTRTGRGGLQDGDWVLWRVPIKND
jgi:ribosomal protein S14